MRLRGVCQVVYPHSSDRGDGQSQAPAKTCAVFRVDYLRARSDDGCGPLDVAARSSTDRLRPLTEALEESLHILAVLRGWSTSVPCTNSNFDADREHVEAKNVHPLWGRSSDSQAYYRSPRYCRAMIARSVRRLRAHAFAVVQAALLTLASSKTPVVACFSPTGMDAANSAWLP